MTQVTFTRTDESPVAQVVSAKVVYGTDFFDVRLNHYQLETADGTDKTYDTGPTKVHGVVVLKNVSYSEGIALMTWIRETLRFSLYRFTISGISSVDLGLGKGVAVTNCRWDGGNTTKGVFEYSAPGIYRVTFPFKFTRS